LLLLVFQVCAQTILFDNFDSYPEGAHLSMGGYGSWIGRWGTNITVSAEESVSQPHSAKMDNNLGKYEFIVYVEDRNEPGSGTDRSWIEVRDKDGNLVSGMSMVSPATTNAEQLNGGNIVVPHR
jgi:hypothetical protein